MHFVGIILGGNNAQIVDWDGFTVVASHFEDGNEFPGLYNIWMYLACRPASEGAFAIYHEHYNLTQGDGYAIAGWMPEGSNLHLLGPSANPRSISNVSPDGTLQYSYDIFADSPDQVVGFVFTSTSSSTIPLQPDITNTSTDGLAEGPSSLTVDVNDVYMRAHGFVLDGLTPSTMVEINDANPSERRWLFMAQPEEPQPPLVQGSGFAVS